MSKSYSAKILRVGDVWDSGAPDNRLGIVLSISEERQRRFGLGVDYRTILKFVLLMQDGRVVDYELPLPSTLTSDEIAINDIKKRT